MQIFRLFLFETLLVVAIGYPQQENPIPDEFDLISFDQNSDLTANILNVDDLGSKLVISNCDESNLFSLCQFFGKRRSL